MAKQYKNYVNGEWKTSENEITIYAPANGEELGSVPAMSQAEAVSYTHLPEIPVDLVIDHSVQVDSYGCDTALEDNINLEFKRNNERYEFLKWAEKSFENYRAVPPAKMCIRDRCCTI